MEQEQERIRQTSGVRSNERIDHRTEEHVRIYARVNEGALNARLKELDKEWDIERVLQANATAFALTGLLLGATVSRRWLGLPAVVLAFLAEHAVHGWCPPLPLFRRLGVRTRGEIDEERIALKALRGDFKDGVLSADPVIDPGAALHAIRS